MRSKNFGILGTVGGAISSILGMIGASCVACCGGVCVVGPLVAILGVGITTFLHKYNVIFIVSGGLLFLFGVVLIIRNRKANCGCNTADCESNTKDN